MKLQTQIDQAQLCIDNEDYEKAMNVLEYCYSKEPNNVEVLEKLALLTKTLDKMEESKSYWEKLVEVEPNSIVAYTELLDLYFGSDKYKYYLTRAKIKVIEGNMNQAIPDYKKAIDNTSDEDEIVSARLLLAKAYEFVGKNMNAIDEYYKILEHRDEIGVYYKMAELYSVDSDYHSAINILQRGLNVFSEDVQMKEIMAGLLIKANQVENAIKYAQNELTKAKIYLMLEQNDKAIEAMNVSPEKDSAKYFALMAEYFFNKKDFENCKLQIEEYRKKDSKSPLTYQMLALIDEENSDMAKSHYNWGKFYMAKGDSSMALNEFLIGHNIDSQDINLINEIIKIYENNGETHALLEFYEKIIQIDSKNENALNHLAKFYIDMGEYNNALNYLEKLAQINPKNYQICKDIAFCYEKLRNNVLAKEYYNKYLVKAPLNPENEKLKIRVNGLSDENIQSEDGFLEKLLSFFSKS